MPYLWISFATACLGLAAAMAWRARRAVETRQRVEAELREARRQLDERAAASAAGGPAQDALTTHAGANAARNEAILRGALDGFFVLGADYRFREVNDAFCRMTGYTREELLSMRMSDLEVSRPLDRAAAGANLRTGLNYISTSHRHRDGHLIQLESCINVLRDGASKILVGFARDVTQRCRADEALRRSEKKYRDLVETSHDLIWAIDQAGQWSFVNNAARRIYGWPPEAMLGRPMTEFIRADALARDLQMLEKLREGIPRFNYETEHLRADGGSVWLSLNAIPLYDDARNVIGATGTAADITEKKQSECGLRRANERFERLVRGMPLGYIVWSPDLRIIEWNPAAAEIFGISADEAVGHSLAELITRPEDERRLRGLFEELSRGAAAETFVLPARRGGQEIRCEWFNTLLSVDVNSAGQRGCEADGRYIASLVRDVSERERLESQLRQAQKMESLGVLAGGIAHDFNNLLVGILGNASIVLEHLSPDSLARRCIERIIGAGRRATELTNRMLAYAGRTACEPRPIDLNAIVHDMGELAASAVPKRVSLVIQPAAGLPHIEADGTQIQQLVMNLIINAAEAIGDAEGTVAVSTAPVAAGRDPVNLLSDGDGDIARARGPRSAGMHVTRRGDRTELVWGEANAERAHVCLTVRDTGCGMSSETMSRMFEPFFTTKVTGRGLGLSAILGFVRAHRGMISVASREGAGTTIRVLLPAATRAAVADEPRHESAPIAAGATVLVIDDEPEVREVVQTILEHRGVQVLCAADGAAGLRQFQERLGAIDVVLLDLNMPGMDGAAVCRSLLASKPSVRVVVSTGFSEQEAAAQFRERGVTFLHKPYTATTLLQRLGAAMGEREPQAEVRGKDPAADTYGVADSSIDPGNDEKPPIKPDNGPSASDIEAASADGAINPGNPGEPAIKRRPAPNADLAPPTLRP